MIQRTRVNYFSDPDFFSFNVQTGTLESRGGNRLIAVNEDFLRGFVGALDYEAGEASTLILRRCGTFFGKRLAQRFEAELSQFANLPLRDRSMVEFGALIRDMFSGCGMGDLEVDWSLGAKGLIPVKLAWSPMQDIGPRGHTGDALFCGILEGYLGHFADAGLTCVQTGDLRLGNREGTTFILAFEALSERVQQLATVEKQPHSAIIAALAA